MSQSPPPYQPPPHTGYPGHAPTDPIAPARAAVLMWLFGALAVLGGVFTAIAGNSVTPEELAKVRPESAEQARLMEQQLGVSLQTIYLVMGLAAIAVGGVIGGVAFLVRRGGFGAVMTGIILTGMLLLMMVFFAVSLLVAGGAEGVVGLCMLAVPSGLLVYQFVTLIQAARGASRVALAAHWAQVQGQAPHPSPYQQTGPPAPAPPAPQPPAVHGWGCGAAGQSPPPQYPPVQTPTVRQMPPEPPPGQPPVQFGYATRPLKSQQSAPPQEQPPPPGEPPAAGTGA